MKLSFSAITLLLMSVRVVVASTTNVQQTVINGNDNKVKHGDQRGNDVRLETHAHVHAVRRSLRSLFKQDPSFKSAMAVLARNAEVAEQTVDQIVADIKHGTVDPQIEQAALATKLVVKNHNPKMRRFLEIEARSVIQGPKGQAHAPSKIAQHIISGGHIPDKIITALIDSNHYLRPGQTPANPTAPPKAKAKSGQNGLAVTPPAKNKPMGAGGPPSPPPRKPATPIHRARDLEGGYQSRDVHERLYSRAAEAEAEAEAEAGFSHEELQALVHATQSNPQAEQAVYHALTMDPNVEKVTEGLVHNWAGVD